MKIKKALTYFIGLVFSISLYAASKNPVVVLSMNHGDVEIELYEKKAPETVKNFLAYVKSGHYNETIFHRVIDNFMIQGGGYDRKLSKKKTLSPIPNEAHNKIKNEKYTIAMARTSEVNSATAQFFINVKDNFFLDHKNKSKSGYGYAVFGKVIKGKDVIDKIKKSPTNKTGSFANLPKQEAYIKKIILK